MEHIAIPLGEIHKPHNWEFANAAAREAATVVAEDIGAVALQTDTGVYWRLTSIAPAWVQVAAAPVHGHAASEVTQDTDNRFVTDAEKTAWNGKQDPATTLAGYGISDAAPLSHTTDIDNPHGVTKTQVGLGNVDNTSDANKPVSTAQQTALNLKVALTTLATSAGAGTVGNTPAGSISATNVQAAINELDAEKVSMTGNQTIAGIKTFSSFPVLPMPGDLFRKADSSTVAFTKLTAGTAQIKAGTLVDVDGTTITFTAATAITMPTLTAGTDYAIYACTDGTVRADASFSAPSGYTTANSRKIGGFHYAPGGNATGVAGGDATPAINAYSFWDLKFKPSCPDPRGMTLVANGFWTDIYLTGVDAITNGSSKYNVTIADGATPPKVPTLFGGNGSTAYTTYTWFEAMEMGTAFGKRCLTQQEFMSAMYGTTEATQLGADPGNTVLNAAFTSKWGVMQSTGVLWVWGLERGGAYSTAGWNANTNGRGSEYNAPNAVLLGGYWAEGAACGSRCSSWGLVASVSANANIGSRFSAGHLQIE